MTIESTVWGDPRYERLASLLGVHKYEAIGRMAHIWAWATEIEQDVVTDGDLAILLGKETEIAVRALVESRLGEVVDGGVRVKGCTGRIEWLGKMREGKRKGGRERAKTAKRSGGRFAANTPKSSPAATSTKLVDDQQGVPAEPATTTTTTATTTTTIKQNKNNGASKPSAYTRCIERYFSLYLEMSGGKKPRWGAASGKNLKILLKEHGESEVLGRMRFMFDGGSWMKPPYTFGGFYRNWDSLIPTTAKNTKTVSGDDLRELAAQLKAKGE